MILNPFQVKSPRGGTLRGETRMREGPPPRSVVVVVHGFKGFRGWGFFPHVCGQLASQGHAVVSFDFSHNGVAPDSGTFSDLDAFSRNTLTREVDELNCVIHAARNGDFTPSRPRSVGLLGHSRGGADALLSCRETGLVDALVTWGAVDHLERWTPETQEEWRRNGVMYVLNQRTGQHMPLSLEILEDFQANRERLDLHTAAKALETPWLIVHGQDDLTVPVVEGRRLARTAGNSARLLLLEGAGHTFEAVHPFQGPTPALDRALAASIQHFGTHLGGD